MYKFEPMAIRQARMFSGMNQKQLSLKIGVSQKKISLWETGSVIPSIEDLVDLADAMEISLDELVGRNEKRDLD